MKHALFTAVFGALVLCCNGGGGDDAGADGASADAGLVCAPSDAGTTSTTMTPPHPPHENKCTAQQIHDYAQCQGNQATDLCSQFGAGQPGADCGACIESQINAPTWGVVVFNGSTAVFNVEGCVDDALGQVSLELANQGPGSCGDLLHASYGCQESACSACTGTDFDSCDRQVLFAGDDASAAGVCAAANETVLTSSLCAPLFSADGGDFTACFPDASLTSTNQQVDWLSRIVTYMCGP